MYKDMIGQRCSKCSGTYGKGDTDNTVRCTGCGNTVERLQAPAMRQWETYPGEDVDLDERYDR